jgi:hypothetical protein
MARAGSLGLRGKLSWRWLVGVAHTARSTLQSPEWALNHTYDQMCLMNVSDHLASCDSTASCWAKLF